MVIWMKLKIYDSANPWGKERIIIYFNTDEFEKIKERYRLPADLRIEIKRWWKYSTRLLYSYLWCRHFAKLFGRNGCGLAGGSYFWKEKIIQLYSDNIWLFASFAGVDDFKLIFCLIAAHEIKHAQDIDSPYSRSELREFETAADRFAVEKYQEIESLFDIKITTHGVSSR